LSLAQDRSDDNEIEVLQKNTKGIRKNVDEIDPRYFCFEVCVEINEK